MHALFYKNSIIKNCNFFEGRSFLYGLFRRLVTRFVFENIIAPSILNIGDTKLHEDEHRPHGQNFNGSKVFVNFNIFMKHTVY